MKRREMKLLLEERFERIALLETRIDTMDQLVEGYRAREQAVLDTLQAAKDTAVKVQEKAKAEATQARAEAAQVLADAEHVRLGARSEAEALLADAISAANTLKTEAERKAIEITATVKADSERMLRDAEIIKREYEEMVDSFNAMLDQNASELEITAARFGEFVKNRKIDRTESRLDGNAFYKSVGELNDAALPDASGDPAKLMQNIYRIQNRPLPEDRQEVAAEQEVHANAEFEPQLERAMETRTETATEPYAKEAVKPEIEAEPASEPDTTPEFLMEDGSGADERLSAVAEPFSEAAWANDALQSKSEPQAEFITSFDETYTKSDYTIHDDECSVSQADAKSAFDALLTEQGQTAGADLAAVIPAATIGTTANFAAKPMEEAARAFDAYFNENFDPSGKTAQDEIAPELAIEPQGIADQAEAMPQRSPEAPATESATIPDATTAPEPFSEAAWAQSSHASEFEPQAEGTLFTNMDVDIAARAQSEATEQQQPSSATDAEKAFDEYIAGMNAYVPAAPTAETVAAPEPFSEAAWAQSAHASEYEPQAEGTLFSNMDVDIAARAQTEAPEQQQPSSATDAEKAFDEYIAGMNAFVPTAPTAETVNAPEPFSEAAWAQSSHASEFEPQAEGTLFTNKEIDNAAPAQAEANVEQQTSSATDAEKAFDEYIAGMNAFVPTAPTAETIAAPEPFSEAAWVQSSHASEFEPQAEGTLFTNKDVDNAATAQSETTEQQPSATAYDTDKAFDEYIAGLSAYAPTAPAREAAEIPLEEVDVPAQAEENAQQPPSTYSDAEKAFDDYLAGINTYVPTAPAAETVNAPEPYSEGAWAQSTRASEFEPQAEGTSQSAAIETEEEPEPEPAPRRYNDYGEIREWEPEFEPDIEPEMGDIPTVSRYMGQSGSNDEISLDDLLDEIIKAGD